MSELPDKIGELVNLEVLYLSRNHLRTLPASIGNLIKLKKLYLAKNELTTLPETLGNLTVLKKLDLGSNNLTSLPKSIGNLSLLDVLTISGSELTSLPESFGGLKKLTFLKIHRTKLKTLPESIGNCSELTYLNISKNQLTELPKSIYKLYKLEKLDVSNNELKQLPKRIGELTQLKDLDLSKNKISDLPESLFKTPNLQELNLTENQLTTISKSLGQLKNIKELQLQVNQITHLPESIGDLENLELLYLNKNPIRNLPTSIGNASKLEKLSIGYMLLEELPESLGNLIHLKSLSFSKNKITLLPKSLGNLVNLNYLNADKNQISEVPASFAQLKRAQMNFKNNNIKTLPKALVESGILVVKVDKNVYYPSRTELLARNRSETKARMKKYNAKRTPEEKAMLDAMEKNRLAKLEKNKKFRLYHDYRIDELRESLKTLSQYEPYKSDKTFAKVLNSFNEKLDRFNIANYNEQLQYLVENIKISESYNKTYYLSEREMNTLKNINHLAAHSLGDIYMTKKEYSDAITYFNIARTKHTYYSSSGTTVNKDYLRMEFDISEAYFKLNDFELASLHLLHNLMNGQSFGNHLSEKLEESAKFLDATTFIPKLEAMLSTLETTKEHKLKYVFDEKSITFSSFVENITSCKSKVFNSKFYKNLKKQSRSTPVNETNKPLKQFTKAEIDPEIFYHHKEINNFIKGLLILRKTKEFANNEAFQKSVDNCIKYLENKTFYMAHEEISYIMDNSFSVKDIIEKSNENQKKNLVNIQHLAAHYKLDILKNNKKHALVLGTLPYIKSVPGFALKSKNLKEIKLENEELVFVEAVAHNGIAASEYGLLHLIGALLNCNGHISEINQLMLNTAKELGNNRVVKFLTQLETNLEKKYSNSLKLVSPPFTIDIQNLQKLKPNQIISKIKNTELYSNYMK